MCTKLKVAAMYVTPGMVIQYKTLSAIKSGKFGFTGGMTPNVRDDKLVTTWAGYFNNRAVIDVEGFREKGLGFGNPIGVLKVACLFDVNGDLAVVTTDSFKHSPEVAKYHGRMPCIIADEQAWLEKGKIVHAAPISVQQKMI